MKDDKDDIFARVWDGTAFRFDGAVAAVFEDMISRSVPGYRLFLEALMVVARQHVEDGSSVYDLGCSLGACSLAVMNAIDPTRPYTIHAVDNSTAMIERCRANLVSAEPTTATINVTQADITDLRVTNASLTVLGFTLQFLQPPGRLKLLTTIARGTRPGGALLLAEKVHFDNTDEQKLQTTLHHEFKRLNAYSDLEIAHKRQALENVLVTDTVASHIERLQKAGFTTVTPVLQCFNFVTLLAIKHPSPAS